MQTEEWSCFKFLALTPFTSATVKWDLSGSLHRLRQRSISDMKVTEAAAARADGLPALSSLFALLGGSEEMNQFVEESVEKANRHLRCCVSLPQRRKTTVNLSGAVNVMEGGARETCIAVLGGEVVAWTEPS